jgi:hypothetical protein
VKKYLTHERFAQRIAYQAIVFSGRVERIPVWRGTCSAFNEYDFIIQMRLHPCIPSDRSIATDVLDAARAKELR